MLHKQLESSKNVPLEEFINECQPSCSCREDDYHEFVTPNYSPKIKKKEETEVVDANAGATEEIITGRSLLSVWEELPYPRVNDFSSNHVHVTRKRFEQLSLVSLGRPLPDLSTQAKSSIILPAPRKVTSFICPDHLKLPDL